MTYDLFISYARHDNAPELDHEGEHDCPAPVCQRLRPWFNEGKEALRHVAVKARMNQLTAQIVARIRRGERAEQSLGNVDAANPNFIGRRSELRRLRETVAVGKVGVLTAIHGLGGMGKTALAIEYAHACAHEYGGGRWQVRCEGRSNLAAAIATLAPALGIEFTDDEKLDSNLQFDRILAHLRTLTNAREPHRCLLILDNVDQPKLLEPAQSKRFAAAEWLHVIATTRLGGSELFELQKDRAFLAVDELPEADALQLIESFQPGGTFSADTEFVAAQEIVRLLGQFTLAVEAAAVYMGQFAGDVTCARFLERLRADGLEALEGATRETTDGLRHDEKSLALTLQNTLERLTEPEKLALTCAALLPADQIALPWIRTLAAQKFPKFGQPSEPGHPDPWQSLLRRLFGMRLLQPAEVKDADGRPLVVRMHRLLQALLKKPAGEELEQMEAGLLEHIKSRAEFMSNNWIEPKHRWEGAPLVASASQWVERDNEAGAYLASQMAGYLHLLGDFVESERLARRALAVYEDIYGPNHLHVAEVLSRLTSTLYRKHQLEEAENLMRRALSIYEQNGKADDPGIVTLLTNLATLLTDTNRLQESRQLLDRAFHLVNHHYGKDQPELARVYRLLASVAMKMNQMNEAEGLLRIALEIDQECYGHMHPVVASDYNALGLVLKQTQQFRLAEQCYRDAIVIEEHVFGKDHISACANLNNLSLVLLEGYELDEVVDEAEELLSRAIAITEKTFGRSHPHVATALNNLGHLMMRAKRFGEAEPILREALAIDESSGANHPAVARDLSNFCFVLKETGRRDEAEPMLRRALEISEQSLGPIHPETITARCNVASLLMELRRMDEAKVLMEMSLATCLEYKARTGETHPLQGACEKMYAYCVQPTGLFGRFKALLREFSR